MKRFNVLSLFATLLLTVSAMSVQAQETHLINAQARVFAPEILHVQPGDTVQWENMTSHNTVSIDELLPEGAKPWRSQMSENFSVTLTVEGVYPFVCEPHIGFGMMGVIVVGKPANIDAAMATAQEKLQGPYRRVIGKLLKVQQESAAQ